MPGTKAELRHSIRARLAAMSDDELMSGSIQIVARLLAEKSWFAPGSVVSLFGGLRGEPDLRLMIPWLVAKGVSPVVFGFAEGHLQPCLVQSESDLVRGSFGVWVPREGCAVIDAARLTLVLTPGVAFDRSGARLGQGKGYFDQLFARAEVKALRVGVCFDQQIVDSVPCEAHDMRMQGLISPLGARMFV